MAVIGEEALKKNLKGGTLLPVYILFGEDAYLKTTYLNKISSSITTEDDIFNYSKFIGQCDLQEVYDAVMQLPMMSDRKCVILNDFDFEKCSETDLSKLLTLVQEVPAETTLILYFDSVETDPKKGAKFKKLIAACEKNGGAAVSLNHRTRTELARMLCSGAAKRGLTMDMTVGSYLVETCGEDINLLTNELQKLCAFVKEGTVTKTHIDEVCTKTVEANIYRLSDCILAQNSTEALKMLDELFFMRLEPMIIFCTVSGVFVDMYRVFAAKQAGVKNSDAARELGYKGKEFLLDKAGRSLNKMDFNRLKLCLDTLVSTDKALKSFGSNPRRLLEEMIVKLIFIIAQGEALD